VTKKKKCSYLLTSSNIIINNINDYHKYVELYKENPNDEIWGKKEVNNNKLFICSSKENDEIKCSNCNKIFSRKDSLKRHMLKCINKENNYIIQETEIRQEFLEHKNEINKLKNEIDNLTESSSLTYKSPEVIYENNNLYNCSNCNFETDNIVELNSHLKNVCFMNKHFKNINEIDINSFAVNLFENNNAGDIYIIQTDFINKNHFKIGKTINLFNRLSTYRCGYTCEPRLHYYYPFKNIQEADTKLKNLLQEYKLKNEIYIGNIDLFREIITNLQKSTNNAKIEFYPTLKEELYKCEKCNCVCMNKDIFNNHINLCKN
jgi:hypothetical protein